MTLKLVCELHQRWGTFISNLGTLGLWVPKLFAMDAMDRWMDRQKQRLLPLPYGRWHNKKICSARPSKQPLALYILHKFLYFYIFPLFNLLSLLLLVAVCQPLIKITMIMMMMVITQLGLGHTDRCKDPPADPQHVA